MTWMWVIIGILAGMVALAILVWIIIVVSTAVIRFITVIRIWWRK